MTAGTRPLPGVLGEAPDGARGFDTDQPLSAYTARAFAAKGYTFVCRYLGRRVMAPRDLTIQEAWAILDAGLALVLVQHVELPGWRPTPALGGEYGTNAARFAGALGVPAGVGVWCDLEGVRSDTPRDAVIGYANAWHAAVRAAGYAPGLYVGDAPGLSAHDLYWRLAFRRYWGAYNSNADQEPLPRGWQLRQHPAPAAAGPVGGLGPHAYDDDVTHADHLGARVPWLAPARARWETSVRP